jgi:hypothetical protein
MNEYQRQAYLSALGVDNYMPRWRLPLAPEPVACELPVPDVQQQSEAPKAVVPDSAIEPVRALRASPAPIADVLRDIAGEQKPARSAGQRHSSCDPFLSVSGDPSIPC